MRKSWIGWMLLLAFALTGCGGGTTDVSSEVSNDITGGGESLEMTTTVEETPTTSENFTGTSEGTAETTSSGSRPTTSTPTSGTTSTPTTSQKPTVPEPTTTAPIVVPPSIVDPALQNLKILFIGNSATEVNAMPRMVERLAKSAGYTCTVDSITWGGAELATYADPTTEAGKAAYAKLDAGYDVVFLQDNTNCISPSKRQACKEACKTLDKVIREKGGKTYLYVRPPVKYSNFGYDTKGQAAEYTKLFDEIGQELGASRAHTSKAFVYTMENNPDINLYSSDNAHPSKRGSYLVACVNFAVLYNRTPVDLYSAGLNEDEAASLQKAAEIAAFG